jgi:23S rRNA (adenine2503-C2)-methyltransferase
VRRWCSTSWGSGCSACATEAIVPLNLYDFTREQLRERLGQWGIKPIHVAQLWNYLYVQQVSAVDEMRALPPMLQARLGAETMVGVLPPALTTDSADGFTRKFLLGLADGRRVETVKMRFTGRVTACVSSQVGCAMGCVFCATGQMGFTRHLTAGEIVAQVVHVARAVKRAAPEGAPVASTRVRNVVLMGMGEPLHNYDAVMHAVDILRDNAGLALGADRITLSTVGVVPGILRLATEKRSLRLAVSLHAATQAERAALVPVARKWPLDELMAACRTYGSATGRRIFFEWTLIAGENDTPTHARAVGALLLGMDAQVNLIPLNPTAGYDGAPTPPAAARAFQRILSEEFSLPSTVRQRRGIDIGAGCGQLAVADPG